MQKTRAERVSRMISVLTESENERNMAAFLNAVAQITNGKVKEAKDGAKGERKTRRKRIKAGMKSS